MKDYKVLVHVIMEADEYQDLQPNWKPKGVDGIVLDEVWKAETMGAGCDSIKIPEGLKPRKSQNFSSCLMAEKNKTKQKKMTWLQGNQARGVPSYSREGQHFYFI